VGEGNGLKLDPEASRDFNWGYRHREYPGAGEKNDTRNRIKEIGKKVLLEKKRFFGT